MFAAEYEGVMSIVGMLGANHPSCAIIQPLIDKYSVGIGEVYSGNDPAEARAIREALAMIQEAGGVMPNVQSRLAELERRTGEPTPEPKTEPAPDEEELSEDSWNHTGQEEVNDHGI